MYTLEMAMAHMRELQELANRSRSYKTARHTKAPASIKRRGGR
ncbi:hypothetical protein [Wenjunlia tyrosinilytica]|uniref:Uncharacterized protein n=1 Tax=Wenjunlia tyrosinilytica TaxID=1544741 RepID=A0A918DY65_9ACTN|nr:hypothetical protein [Wenjunlia tyrosinilytica]GGO89758.1 hypothetical protein GCM10012280_33740 [Wenjunlia tyrosinilytica]